MEDYNRISDQTKPTVTDTIKHHADNLAEGYNGNAFIRAVFSMIPGGGTANAFLSTRAAEVSANRRVEQMKKIAEQMSTLDASKVDKDFLNTEEFIDLVIQIFEASSKTRDRTRLDWYAKILKNTVVLQDRSQASPEEYLHMLVALTPKEVVVLGSIFRQQSALPPKDEEEQIRWVGERGWGQLHYECGIVGEEKLPLILMRLELHGFIRNITKEKIYREKWDRYILTDASREIIKNLDIEN